MKENLFELIPEEGKHLAESKDTPGTFRGVYLDDETNKVSGAGEFRPVKKEDLKGDGLDMQSAAVGAAAGGVVVILYPYVKKLVVEQIIPKAKQIWDEWWGSEESSAQEEEYEEEASFEVLDSISDEGLETAYDRYRENMTDAEAKKELLEAFIMCLAAAKKICRVANADVISPSGEITQGKLMLEMLTRNNLLDSINSIIENTPSLLEEKEVLKLSELLGVELFQEKEYLPINISTIEKSLREAS